MNALVTGGAGFIGSHLVERLVKKSPTGVCVRVVDNLSSGRLENLQPFLSQVEFIQGDLTDMAVCERAVRDIEVIFHEAAVPSVPKSVADPVLSHNSGVHATVMLLDAARRAGVRRIVYAASSSAYGDTATLPKSEDMLPQPLSPYAATKLACEHYMLAFARCYQLDTVALRYFNVFGPRQDPDSPYSGVIARFCLAFAQDLPLTVFGDGEQSRDFTYVDNAVEANLLAARAPDRLGGAVLNVGCGERCSLNQMIRSLVEITGKPRPVAYEPPRAGDVLHSQADLSQIQRRLGYRPLVPFTEGLRRTFEWYKRQAPSNAAARPHRA